MPSADDAVVAAIVAPFAPSFFAQDGEFCYDEDMEVVITYAGEVRLDGNCENNYVLIRSWTATDCAGQTRTREQIIEVSDTTPPVLNVPGTLDMSCDQMNQLAMPALGTATATDDCGEATITIDTEVIDGECEGQYTMIRTFIAVDDCGNESTATQTINVSDNEAPVMEQLEDMVLDCTDSLSDELPAATDNCSDVEVSVSDEVVAGDCPQEYTVIRTFTAMDECGNASTMVQNVTFVDDEAPSVVSGYADNTIYVNNLEGETVPAADLAIEDNCDAEAHGVLQMRSCRVCCSPNHLAHLHHQRRLWQRIGAGRNHRSDVGEPRLYGQCSVQLRRRGQPRR